MLDYETLAQSKLFSGIAPEQLAGLLDCIHASCVEYAKGDLIIEEGCEAREFGIMLAGRGRTIKWDEAGRLIIITLLGRGSETGVLLAASPGHKSPVSVQAEEASRVLLISYDRLLTRCGKACEKHEILLRNYIHIVAEKGLVLHERLDCLLKPTVRDKILTYLLRVARERQSQTFSIPLGRNAMAEYLNIERSSLSRELSHMKRDGLLDYHRNSFRML